MRMADIDWNYLCQNTLRPVASALAAIAVLVLSFLFYKSQQQLHATYSVNQDSIHEDYDALVYGRRLVDLYYRRYDQLRTLGFVDRESRVDWVETIRIAATGLNLPHVSYTIEPQLKVVTPVATEQGGTDIHAYLSRLEMSLGLVHEVDLLRFFDRLESEAPGLMKVDRCELSRQSAADHGLVADTNIIASCSLMMFSVITSDIEPLESET